MSEESGKVGVRLDTSRSSTAPLATTSQTPNTKSKSQVLVIEDVHEAASVLMDNGHTVTRITHAEITSLGGDAILSRLIAGEFYMLWCQTPWTGMFNQATVARAPCTNETPTV